MDGSAEKKSNPMQRTAFAGASRKSNTSRPSTPTRVLSGNFPDDHTQYHGHRYHHDTEAIDDSESDLDSGPALGEKLSEDTGVDNGEVIPEVRDGILDHRDVENGSTLEKVRTTKSSRSVRDPNLVTWDGPNDAGNPKNWSTGRKWAATLIVSSFTFISPVSSSMVAPALGHMAQDLGITNTVVESMTLSIFLLAYAIGPLMLGPLSEIYGRVIVLQTSNLLYLVFNLACGFAQTPAQMIVFRFFSGLGGSAPLAIGGGVLSDLFNAEQRGRAISIYSLAPLLGPAVGPVAGGFISEKTSWRWIFWAVTMIDALIQFVGLFLLQETYPPVLLQRRKARLINETGNNDLHTEWDDPDRTLATTLKIAFTRPFILLFTQPIVQVLALYMAFIYGTIYLVLSTFPTLWTGKYGESIGIGGLNYISLGVGFFLGTQICAPCQDRIYRAMKKRNNGVGKPEFRVPLMIPGSLFVPAGLFIYGWTAQAKTHWIFPNIGAVLFAGGTIILFQCIQTYIVDAYTRYAASAIGAATVLRSLAAFSFPLFAPYMYAALQYGWGNSLLAILGIVIGWPAPILLWKFGERLRERSKFASG